jgi:hypothetical protein
MVQRYSGSYRFRAVYIQEAHAVDEWPISEAPRDFRQHQCIEERVAAARTFQQDFPLPLDWLVDDMSNSFNSTYASWPFRFWVLKKDSVLFKPTPKNASYDLTELDKFLKRYHDRMTSR